MVTVLISVVYLSVISFLFPLQARYENPAKVTIRNALVLGVGMLPLGVLMNVVNYFPILVYLFSPELYAGAVVWWVPVWIGLAAQINSWVLIRIFRKLQPEITDTEG